MMLTIVMLQSLKLFPIVSTDGIIAIKISQFPSLKVLYTKFSK